MPTPRPFGAPTTWKEPAVSEINRQVQRMKDLKTPSVKPQNFMQKMIDKIKKMPKPKVPSASGLTKVGGAVVGGAKTSALVGATAVAGMQLNNVIQETGGYPALGKRILDTIVRADGFEEFEKPEPKKRGLADIRGSKTPGSKTPADTNAGEGVAMDNAGKGNGYPEGVVRPMDYTKDPGKVQPSTVSTGEGSGSGGSGERTSPEGVAQYGQTLGGLNSFNKGFLGEGYDLTDIQKTYQSEALPATLAGVTQLEKPLIEGASPTQKPDISNPFQPNPQPQGNFPEGTKPFASTDKYTPYSTGGNPEDPQDGASSEPDRVERIRQVAFQPKGARQKEVASRKAVRGNFGGDEPDDSTLVSPMYANKKRNEIRDTFLNYEGSSVKAAVAANAVAGFGKDSNADPRFNYGGELLNAKEGMEYKAKDAAMRGLDPSEFLQTKLAKVKDETNK